MDNWQLLIGILISIICHGHSKKIFRASFLSWFLAYMTVDLLAGDQFPDGRSEAVFLISSFPIYIALSLFIGALYLPLRSRLVALDGLIQRKDEKVTTEAQTLPNRLGTVFWKIYFWFLFCLHIVAYTEAFRAGELGGVLDVSDLLITVLAVIGFFCYAYQKKIGFSIFWQTFSLLFIGWDIWINLLSRGYQEGEWIGFLLLSPMYLALILYGFFYLKSDLSKMEQSPAGMEPDESSSKQCPTCGSWDVRWAMIEDGSQGDWCDNCKKSLKATEAQRYVRKKNIRGWVAIVIVVGSIYVLLAGIGNSRSVKLYNSVAQSDLRNVITLQYAYYRDNKTYAPSIEILDYAVSEDVVIYVVSADESHYKLESYHRKGNRLFETRSDSKYIFWYEYKDQKKIGPRQAL